MPIVVAAVFAEWAKYADRILNGSKRIEYRKRLAARRLDAIYIYEVAPVSAVVGMARVVRQGYRKADALWRDTRTESGMDEGEWRSYVGDSEFVAYYELASPVRFPRPIPLSYFGLGASPQSYAYVPDELALGQMRLRSVAQ